MVLWREFLVNFRQVFMKIDAKHEDLYEISNLLVAGFQKSAESLEIFSEMSYL